MRVIIIIFLHLTLYFIEKIKICKKLKTRSNLDKHTIQNMIIHIIYFVENTYISRFILSSHYCVIGKDYCEYHRGKVITHDIMTFGEEKKEEKTF